MYLSELAEAMGLPMAKISVTVKKLQEKGYVRWKLQPGRWAKFEVS